MTPAGKHQPQERLKVDNVCFRYGRLEALRDVSASARGGCITAVLGPNASGKSTLLRCIIAAARPQSGSISLDGHAVHTLSYRALAARAAYVPQRSIVSAAFTVQQVVELGRYALTPDPRRIEAAMAELEVADLAHRPYRELSVGQQQRVTLARAMAQASSDGLLVLDEPTSAMDLEHAAMVYRLLRRAADGGCVILIAMHDLSTAASIADDVWLLDRGRMTASGEACQALEPQRLGEVFKVGFEWIEDRTGRPRLIADTPAKHSAGSQ